MARTGDSSAYSRPWRANQSSSIMASTRAVVPDLQEVGHLGQVGVAHDDVEAAVLLGVAVRLVPGVDDGPLERGLQADFLLEEVGPLGELELDVARRPGASAPTLPAPV